MKKLGNKGFAIASILYSIMVLFLMLLLSILGILGSRKATLDKNKKDVLSSLNDPITNNLISFEHRNITIINNESDSSNKDNIIFALMDGVSATDENGSPIDKDNITYNINVNNIENKEYTVIYTANINGKKIKANRKITFTDESNISEFNVGSTEFTTTQRGNYKIELWGAQGGSETGVSVDALGSTRGTKTYAGGKGAYTSGIIDLNVGKVLNVYVGGNGASNVANSCSGGDAGGYNGGGSITAAQCNYGASGGGATDIRLQSGDWNSVAGLRSRIMVAAGGGGANFRNGGYGEGSGGHGGTLIGLSGEVVNNDNGYGSGIGLGGTQLAGGETVWDTPGTSADFSQGLFGIGGGSSNGFAQSGGGGGYYGGAASAHGGAGGGSSFISGYAGCDAISATSENIEHTGQPIYNGYIFKNPVMYAGNEAMPNHASNSTMIGNTGNGFAKISLIYYY